MLTIWLHNDIIYKKHVLSQSLQKKLSAYFQFVNQTTRKDHILDLFLSNYEDNIDTATVLKPLSNHHLVGVDFQIIINDSKVVCKMIPDYAHGDYDTFNEFL